MKEPATKQRQATDRPTTYLGPAKVVEPRGDRVLVHIDDAAPRDVVATCAFTFPYRPAAGDVLLVLGQPDAHYAVGVLSGARPRSLAFAGDADIHAVRGRLTLSSDDAIELRAPRVTIRAGVLRRIAGTVVEKAADLRRWVRGTLALRAGRSRRLIDGHDETRCENSTTLAKDTVKIDGDQLHLGH